MAGPMKDNTVVTHAGNRPFENYGIVNPPVYHASTVLSETLEQRINRSEARVRYGRAGTPTTFALEDAMSALEQAHGTVLASSGLSAITMALSAFVEAGDHILVTDSTYTPTRNFCDRTLARFGVKTEYFDPLIGAGIITLEQVFPFTLGANVGTTVTAMLAALATGNIAAVTVAFAHLFFNLTGIALVYPLPPIRKIPLKMARALAELTSQSRLYAVAYVVVVFYVLPLLLIFLWR